MKQSPFVEKYSPLWLQFEEWLKYQKAPKRLKKTLEEPDIDVPSVYRQICHHLALSRSRLYSYILIERLNQLVLSGHQVLYSHHTYFLGDVAQYFGQTFPALVRKEWKLVTLSAALFFIPFLVTLITIQYYPEMVYTIMDDSAVSSLESMYVPDSEGKIGRERGADTDVYMFGFYIKHNTGIDFQIFSGGLLFGIGTIFFLLLNGVFIGAAAGHLTHIGYIDTFWGFVAGHSSFELIAMVFAGAAGFKLAQALVSPGRKTRIRALVDNGQVAVQLLYGTATMTIMAAFIEAFWSSAGSMPVMIKYSVGISLWILVIAYFIFMGRRRYAT
ncbi:MAG: stage II sporulation protein M [Thiotrichaceae bacterium]|nr:stage II sporulation protein M [Thiotrichaceae bacterium]